MSAITPDDFLALAGGPAARRLRFLSLEELGHLQAPEWLIDGILPKGTLAAIVGPSGKGKTFLALDWALSVASGLAWVDRPTGQGDVFYIYAEGVTGLPARADAWMHAHPTHQPPRVWFLPEAVNLMQTADTDALLDAIRQLALSPSLILVDTLWRCMVGGDENSARDMGIVINNADRLKAATGATVAIVHHSGRAAPNEPRGSTAFRAAMDVLVSVDQEDRIITVKCEKMKDTEAFEPISMRLIPAVDSVVLALANGVPRAAALTASERQALAALTESPVALPFAAWMRRSGLSPSTFKLARSQLLNSGYVTSSGYGREQRYIVVGGMPETRPMG